MRIPSFLEARVQPDLRRLQQPGLHTEALLERDDEVCAPACRARRAITM